MEDRFVQAQARIKALAVRPSNAELLSLYAHYKQATEGDCCGERPAALDFVNRAKFDAWKNLTGLSKEQAARAYIDLVEEIVAGSSPT